MTDRFLYLEQSLSANVSIPKAILRAARWYPKQRPDGLNRAIETAGIVSIQEGLTDRKRWYQLGLPPSGTPRIAFSQNEVEKLALCRDLLEYLLPDGMERIVAGSLAKASMLMERTEQREKATDAKAIRLVRGRIDYTSFQPFLDCLLKAISTHTVCIIRYISPRSGLRDYEVVPVRLMVDGDTLNVEGWRVAEKGTPEIGSPITLAIQRIQTCTPTPRRIDDCPPLPALQGAFGIVGVKPFKVRARMGNAHP